MTFSFGHYVFEQFKNRGEICSAANTINLKNANNTKVVQVVPGGYN
jgi:hypothetical protein